MSAAVTFYLLIAVAFYISTVRWIFPAFYGKELGEKYLDSWMASRLTYGKIAHYIAWESACVIAALLWSIIVFKWLVSIKANSKGETK